MRFQLTDHPPPPADAQKLVWIDASRGIAASLVVQYHVARHLDKIFETPLLKHIFQFGHAAIDYFFVTSGFIILFVHYDDINKPTRLRRYLGRRATRLLPIYWIALACTLTLEMIGGHPAPPLIDLVWSISLWPTQHPSVVGIAWTLQFEILFYACFALLIANRAAGLTLLLVWVCAIGTGLFTSIDMTSLPMPYWSTYNFEFFAGMAVAVLLRRNLVRHAHIVFGVGLTLLAAMCALEDMSVLPGYGNLARLAYGIPSVLIILGLAQIDRQSAVRVPRWLRSLGRASYGIYLFQFIFMGSCWKILLAGHADRFLPVPLLFIALSGASIAGGVLVSALIEQPLLRLLRKPVNFPRNPAAARNPIARIRGAWAEVRKTGLTQIMLIRNPKNTDSVDPAIPPGVTVTVERRPQE